MRKVSSTKLLEDSGSQSSLREVVRTHLEYWRGKEQETIRIFDLSIDRGEIISAFESLLEALEESPYPSPSDIQKTLREHFDLYEVYGGAKWGEVLVTGYYLPSFRASLQQKPPFTAPLYSLPPSDFFGENPWPERKVLEEILPNQGLEMAYLDPVDCFSLHIQGSGVLVFEGGQTLFVGYAGDNGHPYYPIGRSLKKAIYPQDLNWSSIEDHLRRQSPYDLNAILQLNPRFIFFQAQQHPAISSIGTPVISERSLAVDDAFYPLKGFLAHLEFFDPQTQNSTSRLVIDQDRGGGVKGSGHVDLFMGSGDEAKHRASLMKQKGRLLYLLPKSSTLQAPIR